MDALSDSLLDAICHRGGEYADLLPLCLRCSSVYAGVLIGGVFETAMWLCRRRRPGKAALAANAAALGLMAVVGIGGLYGLFSVPEAVKIFTALYFGSAVASLAVWAICSELAAVTSQESGLGLVSRVILLVILVSCTYAVGQGIAWVLRTLGALAVAGLVVGFLAVNFAFALVLLRRVRRRNWRVGISAPVVVGLTAVEFAFFTLWRAV